MMRSALQWTPFSTVLLISGANWKWGSRLTITSRTTIEIDPDMAEAQQLRRVALLAHKHVNPLYPGDGTFVGNILSLKV
jgi:hypothetical protein